ncbi:hypothetical protein ACFXAF_18015 [Kitasatospora sp. NPDC059463]|uniref:hypothetical protein n=1 Tax=unclassified Kitasatospora TaxID=2633591 RepID=UPI0036B197E9
MLAPGSVLLISHRAPDPDRASRAAVAAAHTGAGLPWRPRTVRAVTALAGPWLPAPAPDLGLPGFTLALLTNEQHP